MGTKNQTATSTQKLPGYVNDAYQKLIGSAQQTASQGYTPYTGGFTPDQQQAFENIRSMWQSSEPAFSAASDAYGRSLTPTHALVNDYMSPYMSQVVDAAMANMQEQNAQQQQGVIGNAIAKGALGGNRVGVAQAELGRQQKLADNQAIANLLQSGFGTALGAAQADKTAALQAGQGYTGLGQTQMQTNLAQTASQLGAGTQQQQFDYQQYLNQLAFPYQQQSWLSGIVGGLGSTAGGTTTETKPAGNLFSQILGTGLQLASLSDRRAKEDVREVGRTFDGQPIYSYRYKGEPATQMGLMAQEVQKSHPDAVGKSGGLLTVDYERATRDAARKGDFASGGVVGYAVGGVPYANDNSDWPSYLALAGNSPYANDNGDFGGYIPQAAAIGGGGSRFPTISEWGETEDPLANPTDAMKKGASNVASWFKPSAASIKMPALYAEGGVVGRHGYAGGGVPDFNPDDFYRGIIMPKGGIFGNVPRPPKAPRPLPDVPTIDTVNALDGDRLGLDVNTTLPPRGEDPYIGTGGGDDYPPLRERPRIDVAGGNAPGEVIYGEGDQFVTRPREGTYSKNGLEALQSFFAGKGLNLAPDVNHGLMQAGAAMASSKSPFFLAGVGEGTTAGLQAWRDYQAMERENALARAGIGQKGEELALQAQRLGAEIPNIGASTLATDVSTQANRFDYKYTPFGVQIIDKISGKPGAIYPYGSMLPTGETATAPEGGAPLFSTDMPTVTPDNRLMNEMSAAQVYAQTDRGISTAQSENAGAAQTQQLLQEMKHNLAQLPDEGWNSPGTNFAERVNFAKGVNTYAQMFGFEPWFNEKEIAAGEDLNKLTTRLGFDLSRILGSGEAASVIMNSIAAVPGGANSKLGASKIIAGLEAANQRRMDYYTAIEDWAAKNSGSIKGFDAYFNATNPPELYALSSYVPQAAMEYLLTHPEFANEFNAKYGDGKDVAKFVLRR